MPLNARDYNPNRKRKSLASLFEEKSTFEIPVENLGNENSNLNEIGIDTIVEEEDEDDENEDGDKSAAVAYTTAAGSDATPRGTPKDGNSNSGLPTLLGTSGKSITSGISTPRATTPRATTPRATTPRATTPRTTTNLQAAAATVGAPGTTVVDADGGKSVVVGLGKSMTLGLGKSMTLGKQKSILTKQKSSLTSQQQQKTIGKQPTFSKQLTFAKKTTSINGINLTTNTRSTTFHPEQKELHERRSRRRASVAFETVKHVLNNAGIEPMKEHHLSEKPPLTGNMGLLCVSHLPKGGGIREKYRKVAECIRETIYDPDFYDDGEMLKIFAEIIFADFTCEGCLLLSCP